jgi:peptidoglycan/xylan/chitin deacetylase (PgdA/CDA1 family)
MILAYHAIEDGPRPLFVSPGLFRRHVEAIAASPAVVVTLDDVLAGDLPERWVALTFDDAYDSVTHNAAPVLADAGMTAAVFCLAGRLGGDNRWPGQPGSVPSRPLASAEDLAELANRGWTIGSHGMEHGQLDQAPEREVVESRAILQDATGAAVDWFAYPYGRVRGLDVVASTYRGAVAMGNRFADAESPAHALPRVDAHYLRRPALLARALAGRRGHVTLRRFFAKLAK